MCICTLLLYMYPIIIFFGPYKTTYEQLATPITGISITQYSTGLRYHNTTFTTTQHKIIQKAIVRIV